MICYIPRCICCGSENFGLGSLHDDYVGLAGRNKSKYFHIACKFEKIASANCVLLTVTVVRVADGKGKCRLCSETSNKYLLFISSVVY